MEEKERSLLNQLNDKEAAYIAYRNEADSQLSLALEAKCQLENKYAELQSLLNRAREDGEKLQTLDSETKRTSEEATQRLEEATRSASTYESRYNEARAELERSRVDAEKLKVAYDDLEVKLREQQEIVANLNEQLALQEKGSQSDVAHLEELYNRAQTEALRAQALMRSAHQVIVKLYVC